MKPKIGITPSHQEGLEGYKLKKSRTKNLAIFGICRGFQILNVALGGTLIQDLDKDKNNYLKHSQDAPRWYGTHQINIKKSSCLHDILGVENIVVNSFHHQACGQVGDDLMVVARSNDRVIEAVESKGDQFILGLQCHPEAMYKKEARFLKLFKRFISESRR